MPAGRPTKYKKEYATQFIEYFDVKSFDLLRDEEGQLALNKHGQPLLKACEFPTKAGFACQIGVDRDTLKEWANKEDEHGNKVHPEFSAAYKRADQYQEKILIQCGLAGVYQGNFAIFTAKNVLGWRDKHEHDHKGDINIHLTADEHDLL